MNNTYGFFSRYFILIFAIINIFSWSSRAQTPASTGSDKSNSSVCSLSFIGITKSPSVFEEVEVKADQQPLNVDSKIAPEGFQAIDILIPVDDVSEDEAREIEKRGVGDLHGVKENMDGFPMPSPAVIGNSPNKQKTESEGGPSDTQAGQNKIKRIIHARFPLTSGGTICFDSQPGNPETKCIVSTFDMYDNFYKITNLPCNLNNPISVTLGTASQDGQLSDKLVTRRFNLNMAEMENKGILLNNLFYEEKPLIFPLARISDFTFEYFLRPEIQQNICPIRESGKLIKRVIEASALENQLSESKFNPDHIYGIEALNQDGNPFRNIFIHKNILYFVRVNSDNAKLIAVDIATGKTAEEIRRSSRMSLFYMSFHP